MVRRASSSPVASVERERQRLKRIFAAAILAAAVPEALQACGDGDASTALDGGTADATQTVPEAAVDVGAPPDTGTAADVSVDCRAIQVLGCGGAVYVDAAYYDAGIEMCPALFPCGLPGGTFVSGCDLLDTEGGAQTGCHVLAQGGCVNGTYEPPACGQLLAMCQCDLLAGGGRRTGRIRRPTGAPAAPLGDYFRRLAVEEDASIDAFVRLRQELLGHGAPATLVASATRAARDEARHAAAMGRLAQRFGAEAAARTRRLAWAPRSLERIARENAVEGCARETFGALVAAWQAEHAAAPVVRRAFRRIAVDELRHAALAWAVARWAATRLDAPARTRVDRARRQAIERLRRHAAAPVPPTLASTAGVPPGPTARALLAAVLRLE
jgi:hypothetical protein